MPDFLLDDVKELLLKDIGDPAILERIKRAAERGEVVSVYERQYVQRLVDNYLRKKSEPQPQKNILKSKPAQSFTSTNREKPSTVPKIERKPVFESKISNEKKTKIAFGIGAIALAAILVVGISQTGIDFSSDDLDESPPQTTPPKTTGLTLEIDSSSYGKGDIISISGSSNPSLGGSVNLSITNSANTLIWTEDVKLKSNGSYSTLLIAGGTGWEASGKYTLKATHGEFEKETSFTFKG